jgi:RNA polymerase sigma factor (sigma-70 family)
MRSKGKRGSGGERPRRPSPREVLSGAVSPERSSPTRSPTQVIVESVGGQAAPRAKARKREHWRRRPCEHAGADSAFWGVWNEHQDYLRRHSLRWMSNNTADAEDALSSAMLVAAAKYADYAPTIVNTRAWLLRLVHNVCMDHHRSRSRIDLFDELPAEDVQDRDHLPNYQRPIAPPHQEALSDERLERVVEGLGQLTTTLSEPLLLRCLDEMSYREIAARLNCTEAAIRKRVQLARDRLRAHLDEE